MEYSTNIHDERKGSLLNSDGDAVHYFRVSNSFRPADPNRYHQAIALFDEANAQDPNSCVINGQSRPRELVYAQWLSDWVTRLAPNASEELRLAARSQHLRRWQLPRAAYPMDRHGYLRWREELRRFHAQGAGEILQEAGYSVAVISRVQALNLKKGFPKDPETRILEDALCLVFLEHQFEGLTAKTTTDKIINALQKAWKKMSPKAQEIALSLPYPRHLLDLIHRAGLTPQPPPQP